MSDFRQIYEKEKDNLKPDPDVVPIKDRTVYTQPYDLVVESLIDQIKGDTIFLRPLSERPSFQRRYVWSNALASKLIESIYLNVPIPPCYLSQNDEFELDVIDGQQRLFSIYRFIDNQFKLNSLEVLSDFNGLYFHQLDKKVQRKLKTHTLRCILITNESHPEIKFDVFERLNTNTAPLNPQEIRNCIYRGSLNNLLKNAVEYEPWLKILNKKQPDKRMRDEELVLRFFAFHIHGIDSYRTPLKHWLNFAAKEGRFYSLNEIEEYNNDWEKAIDNVLLWFEPNECFRRDPYGSSKAINRALFDLILQTAVGLSKEEAFQMSDSVRGACENLLNENEEFQDLISRSVDHTRRMRRRFELWHKTISKLD